MHLSRLSYNLQEKLLNLQNITKIFGLPLLRNVQNINNKLKK